MIFRCVVALLHTAALSLVPPTHCEQDEKQAYHEALRQLPDDLPGIDRLFLMKFPGSAGSKDQWYAFKEWVCEQYNTGMIPEGVITWGAKFPDHPYVLPSLKDLNRHKAIIQGACSMCYTSHTTCSH